MIIVRCQACGQRNRTQIRDTAKCARCKQTLQFSIASAIYNAIHIVQETQEAAATSVGVRSVTVRVN